MRMVLWSPRSNWGKPHRAFWFYKRSSVTKTNLYLPKIHLMEKLFFTFSQCMNCSAWDSKGTTYMNISTLHFKTTEFVYFQFNCMFKTKCHVFKNYCSLKCLKYYLCHDMFHGHMKGFVMKNILAKTDCYAHSRIMKGHCAITQTCENFGLLNILLLDRNILPGEESYTGC